MIYLWCPDLDILGGFDIANENSFSSLVDVGLGTLLTRYKDTYFTAKNFKIRKILLVFSLFFLLIKFLIKTLGEKSIWKLVWCIHDFYLEINRKFTTVNEW